MSMHGPEVFGADPARIKWQIVRGDTSPLRVEFLEDDEITYFDTSDWSFEATLMILSLMLWIPWKLRLVTAT